MDDIYITNAKNIDGKKVNFYIKLPIEKDFKIPKKIVKVSVYRYSDGESELLYNICIGKKEVARVFFNIGGKCDPFEIKKCVERINSVDDSICYITSTNGTRIVYTTVNENDIIVDNLDEMKDVIQELSYEYSNKNSLVLK